MISRFLFSFISFLLCNLLIHSYTRMQSILCRSCISRQLSLSFRNNPICFRTLSLRSLNPFKRTFLTYTKPLNIVYKTNLRFFQQYSRVYQQSVRTIISQSESNPPIPLRTFALFSLSLVGIIAAYMSVSWVLTVFLLVLSS